MQNVGRNGHFFLVSSCNILWEIDNHNYGEHLENYETKVGTLSPINTFVKLFTRANVVGSKLRLQPPPSCENVVAGRRAPLTHILSGERLRRICECVFVSAFTKV